ncbi:unnamed protein product [Lepidochelys olivacea]
MLAAQDVVQRCKELCITALHIKLRAPGGDRTKTPGPGTQSALGALAHSEMKIGSIEDITPSPLTALAERVVTRVVICKPWLAFVSSLNQRKKKGGWTLAVMFAKEDSLLDQGIT